MPPHLGVRVGEGRLFGAGMRLFKVLAARGGAVVIGLKYRKRGGMSRVGRRGCETGESSPSGPLAPRGEGGQVPPGEDIFTTNAG